MDLTQTNETWCIEDTLFYPLGLINHTTGNKIVFVTWNESYLMNFIFKKSSDNTNRCNKFIIDIDEEILDIKILEVNTLVLLANGEVCYFSSIKSIHRIPWLKSGVRCVSGCLAGFCLIRVQDDNRISLEIYKDVPNVGKLSQEAVSSFDLTFDEKNLFNSDWSDEKFTLVSIQICDSNRKFLELLVTEVDLQVDEVHIFTMGNQIFALLPKNGDDYEIKTLTPQISPIEMVKFLEESSMLLIFLNCGIIEVWYLSKIAWILEKYSYVNGSEFVYHTFAGEALFYTDEEKVSRLEFSYDTVQHTCQVVEQSVDAPGMVALTFVEDGSTLVCLSNNNIFYRLSFDRELDNDHEEIHEDSEIFELTHEKVQEMLKKTNHIQEIALLPAKIEKLIDEEYKKQELIAVCRKSSIYSELVTASVAFYQHIPDTPETLIYPGECGLPPFSYFSVISLKIISHEIFKSALWSLTISYSNNVRVHSITPELLNHKFSILIPILRNHDELLPEFQIHLVTYVNIEQDFVCINIPVKCEEIDFRKLFSRNQGLKTKSQSTTKTSFTFKISSPQLHVGHVYEMFDLQQSTSPENLEDEVLVENLYFLGEKVEVFFCEPTHAITVESRDPVAIYYARICLTKYLWDNFEQTTDDFGELRKSLLKIQCQVESKYGTLTDGELHLENLKRVYENLRKDFVWTF